MTAYLNAQPQLFRHLAKVRDFSGKIAEPLEAEDFVIQSMPDVSPTKWHLAHTTWFFETFVLEPFCPSYKVYDPNFSYLFNSYYNAIGERHPRAHRGMLSRPAIQAIFEYRSYVDEALAELGLREVPESVLNLIETGIHHEQQHQELMLTDIKHVLSVNPLHPAYRVDLSVVEPSRPTQLSWWEHEGGIVEIGHAEEGFCFDNETPRHAVLIHNFELANRPVTNQEYLEFVEAGGYACPEFWLSEGWDQVQREGWTGPLYWSRIDGEMQEFTLGGLRPLDLHAPVAHVSFFEADAFARWSDCRLPTEFEWETVARQSPRIQGNFAEDDFLHPLALSNTNTDVEAASEPRQLWGDVWEWTASPYVAYPGYRPAAGALGEYNGKFMSSQWVLRGGSCATSRSHLRATYRNFFHPGKRWQFSGIRLAR